MKTVEGGREYHRMQTYNSFKCLFMACHLIFYCPLVKSTVLLKRLSNMPFTTHLMTTSKNDKQTNNNTNGIRLQILHCVPFDVTIFDIHTIDWKKKT